MTLCPDKLTASQLLSRVSSLTLDTWCSLLILILLQAFYPMEKEMIVNPGEILAARCTYNSMGHTTSTKIGHTGGDEMCNLYLMFYTLSASDDFVVCVDEQNPGLTSQLPEGNDTPLPANPELEHRAMGQPGQGEAGQRYDNGQGQTNKERPVKKQDGGSSRKRPGVDDGDYDDNLDTNSIEIGDGLLNDGGNDVASDEDEGAGVKPRAANYNNGFVKKLATQLET